jgi:hypothetical protein
MKELPRLELTEDPNKKNDYIIFRNSINGKSKKTNTKKRNDKRVTSKRYRNGITKKSKNGRTSKKGIFNIFYN